MLAAKTAILEVFEAYQLEQPRSIALIRLMGEATDGRPFLAKSASIWAKGLEGGLAERLPDGAPLHAAEIAASMTVAIWQVYWLQTDAAVRCPLINQIPFRSQIPLRRIVDGARRFRSAPTRPRLTTLGPCRLNETPLTKMAQCAVIISDVLWMRRI